METKTENTAAESATTIPEKLMRYQMILALTDNLAQKSVDAETVYYARKAAALLCGFDNSSIFTE